MERSQPRHDLRIDAGPAWLESLRCPCCLAGSRPGQRANVPYLTLARGGSWLVGTTCPHKYPVGDDIPTLTCEAGERWAPVSVSDLPVASDVLQEAEPADSSTARDMKSSVLAGRVDVDLSVVIPALDEADNLALLLPELRSVLDELGMRHEIIIVTRDPDAATLAVAERWGAWVIEQEGPGYGGATRTGLAAARGTYILTMDADLSHRPTVVRDLWNARDSAEITIASRYVKGGSAQMPLSRHVLSRVLNRFFSRGLSLGVRDMSSGFRLYRSSAVRGQSYAASQFDIVQEVLVRAYAEGWSVGEVPFHYAPREHGSSHARVFEFGLAYLRTFWTLWKLRNSILSADYDSRAHDSPIAFQLLPHSPGGHNFDMLILHARPRSMSHWSRAT